MEGNCPWWFTASADAEGSKWVKAESGTSLPLAAGT